MKIIIHRGSNEIGGTCIQISTQNSAIMLDMGQPLSPESESVKEAVIKTGIRIDAVIISHPHQDHYGLIKYLSIETPVYIGMVGKKLMDSTRVFLGEALLENNFKYYKNSEPFIVGDFTITPFLVDHSAVDSYCFLIEAGGKRIFYSGDFRNHGRKSILFERFINNPPKNIDLLFLEGTMIRRNNDDFPAESNVEETILNTLKAQGNITFLITSSQNIDRIVSAYRACKKSNKILIIDIYTAWVLEQMKMISDNIPSMEWENIKVYANYKQDQRMVENPDLFANFRKQVYKNRIKCEDIQKNPSNYLIIGKMSHFRFIEQFKGERPVGVIYSQWLGYLSDPDKKYYGSIQMKKYREDKNVNFVYAHTSGHATIDDLLLFAKALNPKKIVPIHTEYGDDFYKLFENVLRMKDGYEYSLDELRN